MIVIYGHADDPPIARVLEAVRDAEVEHTLLDQRELDRSDLIVDFSSADRQGRIVFAGADVPLDAVNGVYARPLGLPARWRNPLARMRAHAVHDAFLEWLEVAPTLVVNRPSSMDSNSSKPWQMQLIAAAGFLVPETLVTTDPDEVRDFLARHGRVIFKSVSGVRSIVQELDASDHGRLDRVKALATQFQAYIPGVDVRVHVVGDWTFAAEVRSSVIDYRYAARAGAEVGLEDIQIPDAVRDRCTTLARRLDLVFCGIDLRRRPDGEYVCFEVNPMPAYSYYEAETGQPISRALVSLLSGQRERWRQ